MEDHLRNRDRLAKEWQALCAYQAEPSVCSIAQSESNLKKNRNPDYVPCEHPSCPDLGTSSQDCGRRVGGTQGCLWPRYCLVPSSPGCSPRPLASVSPDDHVRIKLKAESNPSRSDFINASPIVSDPQGLLPCHPTPGCAQPRRGFCFGTEREQAHISVCYRCEQWACPITQCG